MKEFLKCVPISICGLILGLASLGNLVKEYGHLRLGNGMGICAGILLLPVLAKLIVTFTHAKQGLEDPVIASVAPTFTMAVMVLCTYLLQIEGIAPFVKYLWVLAILGHYGLMAVFTFRFLIKPSVKLAHLYPSWFIVYVGLGVIAVTSGRFSPLTGQINFWIGLFTYLVLLPLIIYRVFKIKNMPDPTLPLITIISAPGSLELTGYLKAFPHPQLGLVLLLLLLSQVLYGFILTRLVKLLPLPFYPSYAAFTFPLVISAFAATEAARYLSAAGYSAEWLELLAKSETLLAAAVVLFVLIHYLNFLRKATADVLHRAPELD